MAKNKTKTDETEVEKPVKSKAADTETKAAIYTYVGGGEDSPRRIHYMGKQHFVRGVATEVTELEVLKKIKNNPVFTEGEVDPSELDEYDQIAVKEAAEQRVKDKATNDAVKRQYSKLASKNEEK